MNGTNIRNILVPIDFSKMSSLAIETAQRLARRFAATAHLAHVRQFSYPVALTPPFAPIAPSFSFTFDKESEQRTARQLNALANKRGLTPVICHVLTGLSVFDEICRLAKKIPADLIVMPTHGHTGLKHLFLGSTAERVVQHSPCPVFVARKTRTPLTIKTILVPVDFSRCSLKGLEYAIAFANELGAKIILLHATYLGYVYSTEGSALYDIPGLQKAARKAAERQMQKLVRAVKFGGVKFEAAFTDASPALDICQFVKDRDIDLIITSTHGLTGFEHVLIGSIAEKVVRHAPCSVLVVPSHPRIRAANLAKTRGTKTHALASSPRRTRSVADQLQARGSQEAKRSRREIES